MAGEKILPIEVDAILLSHPAIAEAVAFSVPNDKYGEEINFFREKISPIEVDAVLLSHPAIAEVVAFGEPYDKYGEEINCAIISKKVADIDVEDVKKHCKKNLAAFKVPKRIFITDSLSKTAIGKIQR
ncbi:hypothetical protein IEQ34_022993 [Dendrobium chrysotoxum]|uniref:AMP-binding enzyme C-terminal domain-containing protein n=1 Tax=Dendrobium chrysotoxum TaxID=161865 RepID=A0AAV7G0K1_DENCH|nr:hypothetical protein IEQ34_022993 [Dendrobium chrysotoxum]